MTSLRNAECRCGQLKAICRGEPVMVSACHCLVCKRRTGSVFAVQARYREADVTVSGACSNYSRVAESGLTATYRFCPVCGDTLIWRNEGRPGLIALPVGAFADPEFPPPTASFFEGRKAPWLELGTNGMEHFELGLPQKQPIP